MIMEKYNKDLKKDKSNKVDKLLGNLCKPREGANKINDEKRLNRTSSQMEAVSSKGHIEM